MFIHILNQQGETVFAKDLPAGPEIFLDAIKPFRNGIVVGCECMFAWYWLGDLCEDQLLPFTLGHARCVKGPTPLLLFGIDVNCCPKCGKQTLQRSLLLPQRSQPPALDAAPANSIPMYHTS